MIKLLKYLKKYWWQACLAPIFMIFEVLMDMILTKQMQKMIDEGISTGNLQNILSIGGMMILIVIIGVLSGFLSGVFANIASANYGNDLRKDLFAKIMQLSYDQTDKFSTGSLITRVTNDVTQMQNTVAQVTRMLVRCLGMFIMGIIFTVSIDAKFALVLAVALPLEIVVMAIFMKKAFPQFSILQKKHDRINTVVHENLTGARVVKAFSKEDYENERFDEANISLTNTSLYVNKMLALLSPIFMIIIYGCNAAIYAIGGKSIFDAYANGIAPEISIGKTSQAVTYIVMICSSLMMVGMTFASIARAAASSKRINEVLDCPLEIKDGNLNVKDVTLKGELAFKNVSFAYPGSDRNILNDLNFTIHQGETVAVVGATGSGKTTLVNLIARFYDVTGGEVIVDGYNVKDYKQAELRDKMGICLQKAELFAGTIRENIAWGKPDASFAEIKEAADVSQAKEAIMNRKKTYFEYIEEKGTSLSGGQKQRISIARAMVKKPEFLIFDDSSSALDLITEAKLYDAMRAKMSKTTKVVVAQRVATAKQADKIIVLDGGTIVAYDTHENLLATCPVYQDIYNSQLKREGAF